MNQKIKPAIEFFSLGGIGEIGLNCYVYGYEGHYIMVDCGVTFGDPWVPGVDVLLPDIQAIFDRNIKISALYVTHGHEDHLGAIAHIVPHLNCDIYATQFTARLIADKCAEVSPKLIKRIHTVASEQVMDHGPFSLEFVPVIHSMPDTHALVIGTPLGRIVHSGDWKMDDQPTYFNRGTSYDVFARFAPCLAFVCDSTNVFHTEQSPSETLVRTELEKVIAKSQGRVVITCFATHVARLQAIIEIAEKLGRKVVLAGRSMHRLIKHARELGYLSVHTQLYLEKDFRHIKKRECLILATGSQGEPRAALARIAKGDHPFIQLESDDKVIFSSRNIPGNERAIDWVISKFVDKDVDIVTDDFEMVHSSGHPSAAELKKFYDLVKPSYVIAVHGERKHLLAQHLLAEEQGLIPIKIYGNGRPVYFNQEGYETGPIMEHGRIALDGFRMVQPSGSVMRGRRKLAEAGILMVVVVDDGHDASSEFKHMGILEEEEFERMLDEMRHEIRQVVQDLRRRSKPKVIEEEIRIKLRQFIHKAVGKKSQVVVSFVSVRE